MDGNRLNFDEVNSKKYHGRRRNATFGNIRFNKNFIRHNDNDSASTSAASNCKTIFFQYLAKIS